MIPVGCGHFLLNEILSHLHFLLGQTVVEHQDVSEHSLSSASPYFKGPLQLYSLVKLPLLSSE